MEPYSPTRIEQAGSSSAVPGSLQALTLQVFTTLSAMQPSLRRNLTLCLGNDEFAPAVALAVLGLGGTCLTLDSDQNRLQAAGRSGAIDFTVSSLTEALRVLKNEVRKGTAVSVGLSGAPDVWIQEMLHRGVQPDLVCASAASGKMVEPFASRGSQTGALPPVLPAFTSDWHLRCDEAQNLTVRRNNDARMLKDVPAPHQHGTELDRIHGLWIKAAPKLFPRDRGRMYWSAE